MSDNFKYALDVLLKDEGGYVDDPNDPGCATNLGITQDDLDIWTRPRGFPENVKDLTEDDAAKYYADVWWNKYNYGAIDDKLIASKVFNLSVNIGPIESHKIAQEALTYNGFPKIKIDGILGPITLSALNTVSRLGKTQSLLADITIDAKNYYEHLVEINPNLRKFYEGWINRASR